MKTSLGRARILVGLVGSLGLLAAVVGCGEELASVEVMLPSVSVVQVAAVDLDEEIRASGDLEARFHTTISAEVAGRVTQLSVDEGGAVERGATVIEIDPERRQLDLAASRARLAQARASYRQEQSQADRIRKLRTERIKSQQQLEEAETALLVARSDLQVEEAAVGVAQRALADASVTAPFAGLVARRSVQLGEFVQLGTELFELVSLDSLEAIFSLTELDSERVRLGQRVEVRVGAFEDRVFDGVVTFVSPTIDPETRTLRIKAAIDNTDGLLRPGLFARMSLGVSRREGVLLVPEEAVIQRASGAHLYRVGEGDRVERLAVETGVHHAGRIEVRGPVAVGDWIVQRGHGGLADGMVVVVRERPPAGSTAPAVVADGALR
ncbi:MAG: efflux RND transporter periplasmic adaptor subunit [Deltaproteobacteria bacterium]|nr:efflux RND transporter periplasmic adaptor subunit [Deltaproteobacteria bacterium]